MQGFKSAFIPYREKRSILRRVNDALAELTGSLPRGSVLAREVSATDEDMLEALRPEALSELSDTDRV